MIKLSSNYKLTILFSLLILCSITALLIESSHPALPILGAVEGLDKVAHFIAFSGLGLMVCGLSFSLYPKPKIPFFSMPFLIVFLSGIAEESYQMLIPGRTASLMDLVADVCGALCAIFLANRFSRLIRASYQSC